MFSNYSPSKSDKIKLEEKEYLSFKLDVEEYAIDILMIKEIRMYEGVIHIADTPNYMKGVINLRGVIIPIIDLRLMLHLSVHEYNKNTIIIILNIDNHEIGIVVDEVKEILKFTSEQVTPTKDFCGLIHSDYITGLGVSEQNNVLILAVDKLFKSKEFPIFATVANHYENS